MYKKCNNPLNYNFYEQRQKFIEQFGRFPGESKLSHLENMLEGLTIPRVFYNGEPTIVLDVNPPKKMAICSLEKEGGKMVLFLITGGSNMMINYPKEKKEKEKEAEGEGEGEGDEEKEGEGEGEEEQ
ncbi:hypothetical protein LIER_34719 [Lithospermum erythrorhizon]|uniref:Uncharacterized protein n=1 Tax=Lithospermum erythrorhizon TaxID=34254 RepID=A0AAV3S099_LITER